MPWQTDFAAATSKRGNDWFSSRREYFIRQVLGETLSLVAWFQHIYGLYRDGFLYGNPGSISETKSVQLELLHQFTTTVGTESEKGPLWQLKDLCHQVWPRAEQNQPLQGIIFDWLIGSLFHECVKLKENLYVLAKYGRTNALSASWLSLVDRRKGQPLDEDPVETTKVLIGQVVGEVARQMERVGFLFGQASYSLRRILPDLMDNTLVIRLLVEQERLVSDVWGETLEELLASVGGGNAVSGLCAAAEAYFKGQWYRESLELYNRALTHDQRCQTALIRALQITALLKQDQEGADR